MKHRRATIMDITKTERDLVELAQQAQDLMNRYGKSLKFPPLQPSKEKEGEVFHTHHHEHRTSRLVDDAPQT